MKRRASSTPLCSGTCDPYSTVAFTGAHRLGRTVPAGLRVPHGPLYTLNGIMRDDEACFHNR